MSFLRNKYSKIIYDGALRCMWIPIGFALLIMKNAVRGFNTCTGFIYRRFRNACIVSVISLCFVFMHYFMKEQWTGKVIYGHERLENDIQSILTFDHSVTGHIAENILTRNIITEVLLTEVGKTTSFRPGREHPTTIRTVSKTPKAVKPRNMMNKPSTANEKLWLTNFTSGLPYPLAKSLQNILTRDFEWLDNNSRLNHNAQRCDEGYFRLKGMETCKKWLGCSDLKSLNTGSIAGYGVGKIVEESKWNGKDVVIVSLRRDRVKYRMFVERVKSGVQNMLLSQPSPYVAQVVGTCNRGNNTVLILENCKFGNFRSFYASPVFRRLSTLEKLKIAIQIVASFDYLHRGFEYPRVHCDLHTVSQAFGQWVVSEDKRVFLSDLDELPFVDRKNGVFAQCEREPFGKMEQPNFLAPEARYTDKDFKKGRPLNPVDQSSDVWKYPDIFANIMIKVSGKRYFEAHMDSDMNYFFKDELLDIHSRCKNIDPSKRPSSKEVLMEYLRVYRSNL